MLQSFSSLAGPVYLEWSWRSWLLGTLAVNVGINQANLHYSLAAFLLDCLFRPGTEDCASVVEPRVAVGHEQVLEVLLRQPSVSRLESSLHPLRLRRIIHEVLVGDKREWTVALADHSVGYCCGPDTGKEQNGFVRTKHPDVENSRAARQSVARNEGPSLEVMLEVVDPRTVAPDRAAKGGYEPDAVPRVQTVGEEDVLWGPVLLQPL